MQSSTQTIIESTGAFGDLFYWVTGGYLGLFFLALAMMVFFLFLPFFVFGIWVQTKRTNNNLEKISVLLKSHEDKLERVEKHF